LDGGHAQSSERVDGRCRRGLSTLRRPRLPRTVVDADTLPRMALPTRSGATQTVETVSDFQYRVYCYVPPQLAQRNVQSISKLLADP
jgi:hypothetical protein